MLVHNNIYIGGSGEIRTHGPFRAVCFQDRCNKPDSATLPLVQPPGIEPGSTMLQTVAMTTSAKVAKYIQKHTGPYRSVQWIRVRTLSLFPPLSSSSVFMNTQYYYWI